MTMAVRLEASIPRVTCSAVEADPNPLGPGFPVTKEKMLISPILLLDLPTEKKKKLQINRSFLKKTVKIE